MNRFIKISLLLLVLLSGELYPLSAKDSYSSSSILSSGQWIKIAVLKDGIYRIDFSRLKQAGLLNPANIRIYGNNFGQLSYYNNDPKPDDLKEIAIHTVTGSDGIFNEGDYLLFYAQGTGRWKYNSISGNYDHIRHNYSDTAFYFLTSGPAPGSRIGPALLPSGPPNYYSGVSDALYCHETEYENLIKSGREWYQPVSTITGITINPGFTELATDEQVKISFRVLARSPVQTLFRLYEGSSVRSTMQVQAVNMLNYTGAYAQITDSSGSYLPSSSSPVYDIRFFNNGETGARGWLDYACLQGRKHNTFTGSTLFLCDSKSASPGRITEYTLACTGASPSIWDVSDPFNPGIVQFSRTGSEIKFRASTDSLRSYVVFSESGALSPLFKNHAVPAQNLHGSAPADMIIVTHPLFRKYAEDIASIHLANSGLISLVVTPEEIYNEFSGGIPDIAAIRNFARMKFLKQAGTLHPLKYLLLFGDGSYENKTLPPKNPNFIPTYQSLNSTVVVSSFTSDDFYGLLEDGEGEADGTEDIGIGRLPVRDTVQAGIVVRKIKRYVNPLNNGDWKNIICIAADDEDGNAHMADAEGLSVLLSDSVPVFNINKIYFDAFRQTTTVNGQSYPDAVSAINNRINAGCLIFNYIGHGSENGLAHERVVKTEDINSWKNGDRLPLFITATCEFSRFDDAEINMITRELTEKTSAGEMVLLNEYGGGIALMSTTRLVYSAPNYFLNKNIYDAAFDRDKAGDALRLGDIVRLAKNRSGNGPNKRNFSLLGDPALRLGYPWHGKVVTDSINHVPVTGSTDSLKALTRITVSGHLEDNGGSLMNDFNGTVTPIVYDKVSEVRTLANDGGQPMPFNVRSNILFSGKTKASDGSFRFTFMVPRDIDYAYGQGRISYYANDDEKDMNGFFSNIVVGGFTNTSAADTSGPEISLFMNDTLFRNGGITDSNPRIIAIIKDEGGINTTGSGIGHDITAYLDNDKNRSIVLNSYFESDLDNYMRGSIRYDLADLTKGNHTITLKAWDNYNNSSEKTLRFLVEPDDRFVLRNIAVYPNPFTDDTKISAEHNRPDSRLDINISIYDISGRIIRIINSTIISSGFRIPPITWDGTTDGGKRIGRGIYPFRMNIKTTEGEKVSGSGRFIIL